MQQQRGERQQRQRAAHHLRPLPPASTSAATAGYSSPVCASHCRTVSLAAGSPVAARGFGEDAQVRGFALHVPVVTGQPQRGLRIAVQLQLKARLLAPVHDVAARPAGVEARAQRSDARVGFRPLQRLLRERQSQQQRVDARLVLRRAE